MSGSPFLGMDPYLEGEMWLEFHDRLANQISQQLLPLLKPNYVALLSKRYVMDNLLLGIAEPPEKSAIYPDVHVVKEAAVAAYPLSAPVELINPLPEEVPILSVEIRDVAERRLVTAIEIFSPVNKRGAGFREYLEKRTSILLTETHLLEVDLLRQGKRIPLIGNLPPAPYYLFLSRSNRRPRTEAWPISLRQPLPAVPVPLLPPDADVTLDLQAAVDACFALVGYERLLDYTQPPPPPDFNADDAAWIQARLSAVLTR